MIGFAKWFHSLYGLQSDVWVPNYITLMDASNTPVSGLVLWASRIIAICSFRMIAKDTLEDCCFDKTKALLWQLAWSFDAMSILRLAV